MIRAIYIVTFSLFLSAIVISCGDQKEIAPGTAETEPENHEENGHVEIVLTPETIKEIGLETRLAEKIPNASSVSAKGIVVPKTLNFAKVGSLIPGRITNIYKNTGDYVTKGQPLFELSSLDISQIVADFIMAKTAFEVSKVNFERTEKLFKDEIGSEKDFLKAQSEFLSARGNLKALDTRIHSIGFTDEELDEIVNSEGHSFNTLTIRTPISGTISRSNVTLGQYLTEEETAFEVNNSAGLWIRISLNEKDLGLIKTGNQVEVISPQTRRKYSGRLIKISNVIDITTRYVELIAELQTSGLTLNSFVDVDIFVGNGQTLALPESAIQFDGKEYSVFVEDEPNTFRMKKVLIGNKFRTHVQIVSGVEPGETVVTQGGFFLKSKMAGESIGEHGH